MNVGIRELEAKLSEYLSRAAAGEEIIVTDRGRPIVRLLLTFDLRQAQVARSLGMTVLGA